VLAISASTFLQEIEMSRTKQLAVRIDAAVIALLKQLARERGTSQAKLIRELILKEVYK